MNALKENSDNMTDSFNTGSEKAACVGLSLARLFLWTVTMIWTTVKPVEGAPRMLSPGV